MKNMKNIAIMVSSKFLNFLMAVFCLFLISATNSWAQQGVCENYCREGIYYYGIYDSGRRACTYTLRQCENGCDENQKQCRTQAVAPSIPAESPDTQREPQTDIKSATSSTRAKSVTAISNFIFDQDSQRGEFRFQDNEKQRIIEIGIAKDIDASIAEDNRILVKREDKEYKIEPRIKELIVGHTRPGETVKNISLRIENDQPIYVLEKTRRVKILGLFLIQQTIRNTIDAANLELIKSKKPWWSIFVKEEKESQQESQPSAYTYNCGNGICEVGETGISSQGGAFYCPYDCGYPGDGVCGADEFVLTEESYVSYSLDCKAACGNKVCEPGESPEICPYECAPTACGNKKCEWSESPTICPEDCSTACGNGICEKGEGPSICLADCGACGDKICQGSEFNEGYCPKDCKPACGEGECGKDFKTECKKDYDYSVNCGDGICQEIETPKICPQDCSKTTEVKYNSDKYKNNPAVPDCGNNICGPSESLVNCPLDCPPPICGNGVCDATENPLKCADDCANVCGDNICDKGETYSTCPCDCSFCGDGVCGTSENKCQLDCVST